MKSQLQFTLLGATMLYVAWGLALLFAPVPAHRLISVGPYDPVSTAFLAMAFVGFAITFLLGARDTAREIVRAAAVILALIGLTAAFLMFVVKMMPVGLATGISLFADLAAAGMLFLSEARMDLERQGKRVPTRVPAAVKKHQPVKVAAKSKARTRRVASGRG